ncbi:Iron-chelator utilization protein [Leucobacter sp. 7(1)]|uniref:siderophore-interacting protein n=1 Tax=Leucobacter sp. 7(1) TaxID=1255613 RepID=UPI00097F370F|nr:siderophore-interacting protein [Leucobacter sp. 7(1)]SJN11953.1 Iron-chelator utilization protein [Leucobacter sp. 7(1)]
MAFCEPAEVVWVTRISPSVIRVRLRAVGPWRWFTDGRGDERIDLAFPRPGEVAADVSYFNDQHAGITRQDSSPPWRHYTTRKVHGDGAEFDVDFVMHDGGVAARWARSAEPGNVLGVFRGAAASRAYHAAPVDTQWQLLVADATGLPGLARIVEELPEGMVVHAVVEVPAEADCQEIASRGKVTWTWVTDAGGAASALPDTVERLSLPDGPGYSWVACEAAVARRVRDILRGVHAQPRSRHRAIGYWTAGVAGHVEQPREALT